MLTELVESRPRPESRSRRGSFFVLTFWAYVLLFAVAGVVSIYAYDERLDAEAREHVEMLTFPPAAPEDEPQPRPRFVASLASPADVAPAPASVPRRTDAIAPTSDPLRVPDSVSSARNVVPSVPLDGDFKLGDENTDAPLAPSGVASGDPAPYGVSAEGATGARREPPPPPSVKPAVEPVKPDKPAAPRRVSEGVLKGMALDLPQPAYDPTARRLRISDTVTVQIVIDEEGRVTSARAVSGHALLRAQAARAALRARFKPTLLSGSPVKVQGMISYRFTIEG